MKENLTVHVKEDGTWLEFNASNDNSALVRIENIAERLGPIAKAAVLQWCEDRRTEKAVSTV